jgi:hypothetical protein
MECLAKGGTAPCVICHGMVQCLVLKCFFFFGAVARHSMYFCSLNITQVVLVEAIISTSFVLASVGWVIISVKRSCKMR